VVELKPSAERGHAELILRIRRAASRWRRERGLSGLSRVGVIFLAGFVPYLIVDSVSPMPPVLRVSWLCALLVFVVAGLVVWVWRPLARRFDPVAAAAAVEREHPELGEELEAAAELWRKRGETRTGYSVELIDALILRVVRETSGIDFSAVGRTGELRRWRIRFGAAVIAGGLACFAVGPRLGPAVGRLAHPLAVPEPPMVSLAVEPGDVTLVAGSDLAVRVAVTGPARGAPVLETEHAGEPPQEAAMAPAGGGYRAVVRNVRETFRYAVVLGEVRSPWYSARVIERPFVAGIRLDYRYPAYSGLLPKTVDENNGDITALKGTTVGVTVSASKPLERAWLDFGPGREIELTRLAPDVFECEIRVLEDASYAVRMLDVDGLENPDPPTYSVVVVRDEYPLVRIVEPGEDGEVPRGMMLPVAVSAVDDYGITRLSIRYSIEGRAGEGVVSLGEFTAPVPRDVVREATWDLSETGILPGSALVYFAEVVDNDEVGGPKVSRSESYVLRFPSMAELYQSAVGEQEDVLSDLGDLVDEQRELRDEFGDIQEDIRSQPTIDWQKEERVERALERQEDVVDKVAEMAERMSELTDKMSETDRITLETLEKMDELTRLLDEVATDEMRELLEQIRRAMDAMSPEEVSRAMEETSLTQDDYLRRLEQTLNLLRRVKAEQDLADIANRANELASKEERIAEEAKKAPNASGCRKLASEQEGIQKKTEELRADLERAIEEMRNVDRPAAREMEGAAAAMDREGTLEKMSDAKSFLEAGEPTKAEASCRSAANDLLALFSSLSSCRGGMSCRLNQRDRETTLRAIDELLSVSGEQEEIVAAVEGRRRIPRGEIVELVAKETDLVDAMTAIAERMFQVSGDSFVIDPAVYRSFGIVQASMTRAAAKIADGGTSAGYKEARLALGRVNRLIVELLTARRSQSSGGGSALEQLMSELRRMAEEQQALTSMTEELRRQLEDAGMGSDVSRQLAEMKAHQQRILEEARRLAKEFGDRREILGRLEDTVGEIEETLAEMERSGASEETINRQKRILSRLLDAQRSLRRRDYKRERRSRPGEEYVRSGPQALPEEITRATEQLREDLLRAMQRDYPPEYRALIRAYFEGLSRDVAAEGAR